MDKLQQARKIISEIDQEMADLFVRRMQAAEQVARYKQEHDLPIFDGKRERELLEKGCARVEDPVLRQHYARFLQNNMDVSKDYQRQLLAQDDSRLRMELGADSYEIFLRRDGLEQAAALLDLDRKVCIVTDSGVPRQYVESFALRCKDPMIVTVEAGEASKTLESVAEICRAMMAEGFSRKDCVAAVGGGMVGDLAGFAAASFMRGVDFYNLPTTLLSQVDSSIGGKTGVNLDGVKNMVGAFYQPRAVLIDSDTLGTLPPRLRAEGLAECVKMALCMDADLFERLEREDPWQDIEQVIRRSLVLKKQVVEQDVEEKGLRKVLNFGHTIGHGVESAAAGSLYHGECVAIGMMPMCAAGLRPRLEALLSKLGLPVSTDLDKAAIWEAMLHDKKSDSAGFSAVFVEEIGKATVKTVTFAEMKTILEGAWQA